MEHIQLQTPWKRGGDWKIEVAGTYCYRRCGETIVFACFVGAGEQTNDNCDYNGPLSFSAPEPMPELVRVDGCSIAECILDRTDEWLARCDGQSKRIVVRHKDERTAREAFNAAAKVLNGEGK